MAKKLFIFGAGSSSRDILQIISQVNESKLTWDVVGFVDPNPELSNKQISGLPIYKFDDLSVSNDYYGIGGIMDPKWKKRIVNNEIKTKKYNLATIVHPNIVRPSDSKIGPGSVLFPGVTFSVDVKIGNCVWVDKNSLLGHNLRVGDYTSIMPSTTISGNCKIGSGCIIGAGAITLQNISIGNDCLVGIGTTIIKDVPENTSVIDFPRKIINKKHKIIN